MYQDIQNVFMVLSLVAPTKNSATKGKASEFFWYFDVQYYVAMYGPVRLLYSVDLLFKFFFLLFRHILLFSFL